MKTLAYNIDPLLESPPQMVAQSLLDAIPDLALSLPGYKHLALTRDENLKFDATAGTPPLGLLHSHVKPFFWQNPDAVHRKALRSAFRGNSVDLWITTDHLSVFEDQDVKTLLISTARILLGTNPASGRKWRKPKDPVWISVSALVVPHQEDRKLILQRFPQLENRIHVVYPALEEPVAPLDWSEQEQLKLRYSGGRDYFLYAGNLSADMELLHLLKAYSLVKKWLMTGMPLILAGPPDDFTPTLEKMLLTYKYRSDVSVYTDLSQADLKELVAGAYALVFPSAGSEQAYALQWAFSAGTPVVASESRQMAELTREAAQLSPAGDIDQLAHAMMVLYKDEYLRGNLITKGNALAGSMNRNHTLQQYKAVIMGLLGDNG